MDLYEKNITALESINPSLVSLIIKGDQALHYEVYMDENNLESLNLVHNETFKPVYATKPEEFIAEQKITFLKFQEYPYLYFFGMGNGVLLKDLLRNPMHQRVVIVEPDPLILYVVFHLIDFSQALLDKRLVLFGDEQINFPMITDLFSETCTQRYARVYDLHIMSPYYETFTNLIHETNHLFIEAIHHTIVCAGNDTKDALIGLKQHLTNITFIPTTPPLYDLFAKAKTTDVAVLVSTGPSLGKQLELLKKVAPYVTIFAVDASLPVLIKNGIKPDVVTSLERVPLTARFFQAVPKEKMQDIVTVLSSLQHADVINSVQGGQKVMSIRPLGYMRLTGPKEWGYIGIGMSAANMAYELIYHSQFKTCILIGQDLAYSNDGKSHASGHVFGEEDVKQSDLDGWTTAYGGQGRVKTTALWNMFRGFFEKDIEEAKARMLTINATEGGAQIFGAQELPFAKAISLHVKKNRVKTSLQLSQLALKEQKIILEEVTRNVKEIKTYVMQWQKRVETLFLDVAHTCEALDANQTVLSATLQALLERIDAVQKARNEEMFDKVIWHIAQSMMLVQDIAIAPIEVVYTPDEKSTYLKRVQLLYAYKSWLFALAGSMDAIVKTITYGEGRSLIHRVEKIDVWVNDVQIDTLTCKGMKAQTGRVFDVDMRGILYDVPDEYVGRNIIFKDAKTGEVLPESFVHVIARDDEQYNKLRFMASLEEPIDAEKIKEMYCPNTIGFLLTRENLKDEEYVIYVKEIIERFDDANFKAFYFYNDEKEMSEKIFNSQKLIHCAPQNIYDVVSSVEIFIDHSKTLSLISCNIVQVIRKYSDSVLVLSDMLHRPKEIREGTILHFESTTVPQFYKNFISKYAVSEEDQEKANNTLTKLFHILISNFYRLPLDFPDTLTVKDTVLKIITYALLYKEYKMRYIEFTSIAFDVH